jgi:hypothetical protein
MCLPQPELTQLNDETRPANEAFLPKTVSVNDIYGRGLFETVGVANHIWGLFETVGVANHIWGLLAIRRSGR